VEESMVLRNELSPGALHFVIHSYDQPAFASRALIAANIYVNSSVSVPHAIHMPSHIYNDLGLWFDAVDSNVRSLNTAYQYAQSSSNGQQRTTGDWYHGSYFLQFEMLQKAMDCDAASFLNEIFKKDLQYNDNNFFYNLEAIVRVGAHYLIETRQWQEGATFDQLEKFYIQSTPEIWDDSIWTRIYANFVATVSRAILNLPANQIIASCNAIEAANKTLLEDPSWNKYQLPYWRMSFQIMVMSAQAWKEFRVVSMDSGIEKMKEVVAFQMSTWAPEVGHLWDPHEQLAEMYIIRSHSYGGGNKDKLKKQDLLRALASYEDALKIYPNRYHSLAGAGNCAEWLKDTVKTSYYYSELITLTSAPFPDFELDGFSWTACPTYASDRRPAIKMAHDYFHILDLSNSCEDHSVNLTVLILIIVVIVILGIGLGWISYKYFMMQHDNARKYYSLLYKGEEQLDIQGLV
jgi:tetratricopeptide (TPR) repeat protein